MTSPSQASAMAGDPLANLDFCTLLDSAARLRPGRSAIMALMCQGRLDFEALASAHLIDPKTYFAHELQALASQEADGLVQVTPQAVEVPPLGWFVVRSVAAVFDRHLQQDRARERYSKII